LSDVASPSDLAVVNAHVLDAPVADAAAEPEARPEPAGPAPLQQTEEPRAPGALRSAIGALRQALGNDGIRRLGISWMLGIAAEGALTVVTLVTVFNRGGVFAAGILGAVRMIFAVAVGMMSG